MGFVYMDLFYYCSYLYLLYIQTRVSLHNFQGKISLTMTWWENLIIYNMT